MVVVRTINRTALASPGAWLFALIVLVDLVVQILVVVQLGSLLQYLPRGKREQKRGILSFI